MSSSPKQTEWEKNILQEFDDYHSRCIGSDAEYTDAEMAKIISDRLKSNYEWDRNFLLSALASQRKEIVEKLEGKKLKNPEPYYGRDTAPITREDIIKFGMFQRMEGRNAALSDAIKAVEGTGEKG